jgi:hypothetical protein
VLALHIADIGRAAVGLHLQQLLEVDRLALGFQFRGALLGRLHQGVLRGRHSPPRRGELAALGSVAHDRSRIVRKHPGHRRQIADVSVDDAEQCDNGGLVRRDRVEIAHRGLIDLAAANGPRIRGSRSYFREHVASPIL